MRAEARRALNLVHNIQRQHNDLVEISKDISASMQGNVSFSNRGFRKDLSFLEGKLKIHLTMEDKHLYPVLFQQESREVREIADEYKREMMSLFDTFHAFMLKVKEADGDNADSTGLRNELQQILEKIAARIFFEEETLIPLLNRIGFT